MKKILIFLFAFVLVSFGAIAQSTNSYVSFAADSTLDAETVSLVLDSPSPITRDHAVTLVIIPVNNTGTATVLCTPQGSLDGTVFFDLQAAGDTVNNAGAIAVKTYTYADAYWRYYRYKLVSSGSGVTDFTGNLGLKRKY